MKIHPLVRLAALATGVVLAVSPAHSASLVGDLDLLANGVVPPNVMILFDNSQSMDDALGTSTRVEVARDAMVGLVNNLYPDDGMGGYDATVRLGLAAFNTSCDGGGVLVPIGDSNKPALLSQIDQAIGFAAHG